MDTIILGIESSCDDTSAAVIKNGIVELIQGSFVFSLTLGAALKVSEIFLFPGNPGIYQLLMFFYPFFRSFFFIIFIL